MKCRVTAKMKSLSRIPDKFENEAKSGSDSVDRNQLYFKVQRRVRGDLWWESSAAVCLPMV